MTVKAGLLVWRIQMDKHYSMSLAPDPVSAVRPDVSPLGVLDAHAVSAKFRRGEEIYGANEPVDSWYRVLAGSARRFTLRANGRRQIVDLLLPGDIFGFGIDGKHHFSAEAGSAGTVIARYPRARIEVSAASDSVLARELREMLTQETSRLQTLILILGGFTAEEKVAAFLVNLSDRLSSDVSGPVPLPISRYDIADLLALSVETVSRALTSMKERGIITLAGPRRVQIVDHQALDSGDFRLQPDAACFAWTPACRRNDPVRAAIGRSP
jgi:CRP/FNR family transcriptional regulator, nitrogen fixation regulation protein